MTRVVIGAGSLGVGAGLAAAENLFIGRAVAGLAGQPIEPPRIVLRTAQVLCEGADVALVVRALQPKGSKTKGHEARDQARRPERPSHGVSSPVWRRVGGNRADVNE
jgi:hypothetical protein